MKVLGSEEIDGDTIIRTDLGEVRYYTKNGQLFRKLTPNVKLNIKQKKEVLKMANLYFTAKGMYEVVYEGKKD